MHLLSFHRRIVSAGLLLRVIDWIFENCYSRINIYGQEKESATYRLAKMNLALRGISHNLGATYDSSFTNDQHKELYFNYIMANPPFNLKG